MSKVESEAGESHPNMRLSKYVSKKLGISRQKAEVAIRKSGIEVNGKIVKSPAEVVCRKDTIFLDNKQVPKKVEFGKEDSRDVQIFAFNKPPGFVVTRSDENKRKTVYDILPEGMQKMIYIGRLDLNSEGLLLFTNSGEISNFLSSPKHEVEREYHVRAFGHIDAKKLKRIQQGVYIDGESHRPKMLDILKRPGLKRDEIIALSGEKARNTWLRVILCGGKNREIRKLFEHFNLSVNRLVRVRYGPFKLDDLPRGLFIEVQRHKVRKVMQMLDRNHDTNSDVANASQAQ